MNLILSQKAFAEIEQECLSHPHAETGGILVGRFNADDILAILAIGSGPAAHRRLTRFEPDVAWQQAILDGYFEEHGVNYVGSFHRHFGSFSWPSSIDYATALQILSDPDWAVSQVVFPIILLRSNTIEIYPYYISREHPKFELIALGVVPDSDPLVSPASKKKEEICPESYYLTFYPPW